MRQRGVEWIVVCALVGFVVMTTPVRIVAQTDQLLSPWSSADIGMPSITGSSSFDSVNLTLSAGGADIWGASDQFHFVYQQISGDVDILASVDSLSPASPWSKVGIMIRSDLTPSAAHAFALVSGANGLGFERRLDPGATSDFTPGELAEAPRWVRLVRAGTTVTGYSSADGASWQKMDSATIALGDSAYVGIALTSQNPDSMAQALVSQVGVVPLSIPTGQQAIDIGSPAIPGATSFSQGAYTTTANGIDIWDTWDQFRFVFQPVSGNVDISARVDSIQGGGSWAKAGVMIRESLDPNARHAMALVSAGNGLGFEWRLDPGGLSDYAPGGDGAVPVWVRLVRTGTNVEAFRSDDGASWTSLGAQIISMADAVYVGLAVTSQSVTDTTTTVIDQLAITQSGNLAPTVSLTAPAPGSQYTEPAHIVVSANAADPQNQLVRVEFYANSTRINSLTAAPFAITWPAVPAGTYSLTAAAFNAAGLSTTSSPVTITVLPANPTSFAIFNASSDHATLVASYRLDVFIDGSDPNTATPVASSDLGKPTPNGSGVITVDCSALLAALPPGGYLATVSAVNGAAQGRSDPFAFVR